MPENALFAIGRLDYQGVLASADEVLIQICETMKQERRENILIFSCYVRALLLGDKQNDEMKKVMDLLGDSVPFMLSYSGGELCPVGEKNGIYENRFQNFSFAAWVF
jgi:hypothetical protein